MYDEVASLGRLSLEGILKRYPQKFLVWLYDKVLWNLTQECAAELPEALRGKDRRRQAPAKPQLLELLKAVLEDVTLTRFFIDGLPKKSRKLYGILVWEPVMNLETLEKKLGSEVAEDIWDEDTPRMVPFSLKEEFGFLIIVLEAGRGYRHYDFPGPIAKECCSVFLPNAILKAFKPFFPPPPDYTLLPVDDVDAVGGRRFTCVDKAMADMRLTAEFIAQGHLKYTKTGRPTMPSLRNLHRMIDGPEFFEEEMGKELRFVRSRLLLGGMAFAGVEERENLLSASGSAAPLRAMMTKILLNASFLHEGLLSHLTSIYGEAFRYSPQKIKALFSFFGKFPSGNWVSFENMNRYFALRGQTPGIFSDTGNMIEARMPQGYRGWANLKTLRERNERELLARPLLRGYAFLLAAFGLAEIVYEAPETGGQSNACWHYITVFDGLQFIRLTALGEYVFGQRSTLDVEEGPSLRSEIILDDARLLATCREPDAMTELAINQFLEKLTQGRYRMTAKTLLGGCSSREDVEERIRLFRRVVSATPPPVWEEFFARTLSRISPLEREPDYVVFKVGEGEEILRLFASDLTLRELALKVEGRRVAVRRDDLAKLAKRLEQLGYLSPLPSLGALYRK